MFPLKCAIPFIKGDDISPSICNNLNFDMMNIFKELFYKKMRIS